MAGVLPAKPLIRISRPEAGTRFMVSGFFVAATEHCNVLRAFGDIMILCKRAKPRACAARRGCREGREQ
jgi:hypothetical protein